MTAEEIQRLLSAPIDSLYWAGNRVQRIDVVCDVVSIKNIGPIRLSLSQIEDFKILSDIP